MNRIEYKVGDLVWGKYLKHQYWPASITDIITNNGVMMAKLEFIGKKSSTYDSISNLEPFIKCSKIKTKGSAEFKEAVLAAIRIFDGKNSLEGRPL